MKHRKAVDVLVVGAGPCGLAAALRLSQAGVNVKIIDAAEGITSRSYACGIHPGTLSVPGRGLLLHSPRNPIRLETVLAGWGLCPSNQSGGHAQF